jgi:hypothetical protein
VEVLAYARGPQDQRKHGRAYAAASPNNRILARKDPDPSRALKETARECYHAVKENYEHLLGTFKKPTESGELVGAGKPGAPDERNERPSKFA